MKMPSNFKSTFLLLFFFLFLIQSCFSKAEKKERLEEDQSISSVIELNPNKSTFLYCTETSILDGDLKIQNGNYMTWKGNASLTWDVEVSSNSKYELYLIANVREEGKGKTLTFKTDNKLYHFKLAPTNGPYKGGLNFERVKLSSEMALSKGAQKLTLLTEGISSEDISIDIRSIELLPISAKEQIAKERDRAIEARSGTAWMNKTGYGVMFHWTSQSVQPDGSIKKYKDAVNDFDVEQFSNMVEETGAGYVMFTIGHAESYCPAPIASWEKVHHGQTTKRDLIEEIADALNKKGVELIVYINGPLGFNLNVKEIPTEIEKRVFVTNFKNILNEMGLRYKDKIAGYWFDSWYQIFEKFPEVPFEEFNKAAKTGYKDRIISLNSWIYPAVTPRQDYWAGEVASPIAVPENGYMKNGPVPDLPYQALLIMEPYWVQQKAEMPTPRFTSTGLSEYIQNCQKNGGMVTINLGIYQDGTVGERALQVMKEVKNKVRKNHAE